MITKHVIPQIKRVCLSTKYIGVQDTHIHSYTDICTRTHTHMGGSFTFSRKLTYIINDVNIITHSLGRKQNILKFYTTYNKGNSVEIKNLKWSPDAWGQQFTQVLHLLKDCQTQEENGTWNWSPTIKESVATTPFSILRLWTYIKLSRRSPCRKDHDLTKYYEISFEIFLSVCSMIWSL